MISSSVLLICTSLISISFQQQITCIPLKGSKICTGLENYSILPSDEFKTIENLDSFLQKSIINSTSFDELIKSQFKCTNYNGKGIRYAMSTYCALLVQTSASQCSSQYAVPNTPPLTLCSSACTGHIDSLKKLFSNTAICEQNPPQPASTERSNAVLPGSPAAIMPMFCQQVESNPLSNNTATCFGGVVAEAQHCGFNSVDEKTEHCAAVPNDSCCHQKASAELLSPVNNTALIAGIVAGVLVLIGVGFFIFQRMSKANQRPTTAYEPNRASKAVSKAFSFFRGNDMPPPVPEMQEGRQPRSSLFTTIRASQIFQGGQQPPLPSGPITLPAPVANNNPYEQLQDDQYQPSSQAGLPDGFKVQVFEDYDAGMDDEISCTIGDIILVKEEFDDGWATGFNITSGAEGIFPMAICEQLSSSMRPPSTRIGRPRSNLSARAQSLLPPMRF